MIELNKIHCGDCQTVMRDIDSDSVDCIVTDPPYFMINNSGSGFMGKSWDSLYGSKLKNVLCKSKEFAAFVARFFMLMQVESNTKEDSIAQENVNITQKKKQSENKRGYRGDAWDKIRKECYRRDRYICQLCGKHCGRKEIQAHHIKPYKKGGSNKLSNLITLCNVCHARVEQKPKLLI